MKVLAIETSCDETSAAVIENSQVLSNVIASQLFHAKHGGVIPELASRAHLQTISEVTLQALNKAGLSMDAIDGLAVTKEPGLAGALLVGANFAKGLSVRYGLPLVPVNHIEGHIFSGCIEAKETVFPFVSLVVSGGHTALFHVRSYTDYEMIGSTIDDAAGEAFDKIAKILGFPYPGGPMIDKIAKDGNPHAYPFPRPMMNSGDFNFSFSGLKTSVRYFLQKNFPNGLSEKELHDVCASVQEAITEILAFKAIGACRKSGAKTLVIGGGVSANSGLRERLLREGARLNIVIPDMSYCVDNAAMIGFLGEKRLEEREIPYGNPSPSAEDLTFRVSSRAMRARSL